MEELKFEVVSRLGRRVRITKAYWNHIVTVKHRSVKNLEENYKGFAKSP